MGLLHTSPMTDSGNYTVSDSNKAEVSGGVGKLKKTSPAATKTYNETSSPDASFNSSYIQKGASGYEQKDLRPSGSLIYSSFNTSVDANWANGATTGSATGCAGVDPIGKFGTGALAALGSTTANVSYSATNNADFGQVGTISLWYRPAYSGTPSLSKNLFTVCKANGNTDNIIQINHSSVGGTLKVWMKDDSGVDINNSTLGTFSPTQGTWYHIELDVDVTTGATRLFVNGVQSGTDMVGTGTRGAVGFMCVSGTQSAAGSSNCLIDEVLVYDAVKHTGSFSAPSAENDHSDVDLMCAIHYNSGIDIDYSRDGGALTGTATNANYVIPKFGDQVLRLNCGSGSGYLDYDAGANAAFGNNGNSGHISLWYLPDHDGNPPTAGTIFTYIYDKNGATNNSKIQFLYNRSADSLSLIMYDNGGTARVNVASGYPVSWVGGQWHHIELDFEGVTEVTAYHVYINGVRVITGTPTSLVRTNSDVDTIRIGSTETGTGARNGYFDEFIIRDDAVNTGASFTVPSTEITQTKYTTTTQMIEFDNADHYAKTTISTDTPAWTTFTEDTANKSGTTSFVLFDPNEGVDGEYKYWDGALWSISSGSSESNTAAEINANISTFPAATEGLTIGVYLSGDGSTQARFDGATVGFTDSTYPVDDPYITLATALNLEDLEAFDATVNATGSDGVKFVMVLDGTAMYFTPSRTPSDGSYTQANTYAEINTNAGNLIEPDARSSLKWRAILHSADGSTTPTFDDVVMTYNFHAGLATEANECIIYGWCREADGDAIANMTVEAKLKEQYEYENTTSGAKLIIRPYTASTTTDSEGYWELSLIENTNMETGSYYEFKFYGDGNKTKKANKLVPNESSKNYTDLESA